LFSSRRRHTRSKRDWSSDVCSSDLDYYQTYKNDLVGLAIHIEFEGLFKRSGLAHIDQLAAILRDAKDSGSTLNIKGLWTHFGYEIGRASCRERGDLTCSGGE